MVIGFCLNLIQLHRHRDGPLDTQPDSLIVKYSLQRLSVSSLLGPWMKDSFYTVRNIAGNSSRFCLCCSVITVYLSLLKQQHLVVINTLKKTSSVFLFKLLYLGENKAGVTLTLLVFTLDIKSVIACLRQVRPFCRDPVSYTHLTLPTSDLV